MQLVEGKFGSEENEEGLQTELVQVEGPLGWTGGSEEDAHAELAEQAVDTETEKELEVYRTAEREEAALRSRLDKLSPEEKEAHQAEFKQLEQLELYLGSNYHLRSSPR